MVVEFKISFLDYYITSLLQLEHIKKFDKVFFQEDVVELSKVRMFYKDFKE